jgi:hypothetical protein
MSIHLSRRISKPRRQVLDREVDEVLRILEANWGLPLRLALVPR